MISKLHVIFMMDVRNQTLIGVVQQCTRELISMRRNTTMAVRLLFILLIFPNSAIVPFTTIL